MKRVTVILEVLILVGLVGCGKSKEKTIIGKWKEVGGTQTIEFFKDGTVTVVDKGESPLPGDYRFIDDNHIRMNLALFGPINAEISPSLDEITLTNPFGKVENYRKVKQMDDIISKYVFEGGIVGEKAEREPGVFVFNKDGTISYVPPRKRKIETSFTWEIVNEVVKICEDGEILFSDGKVESGNIVFDKFGTIARFIEQN